MTFYTIAEAAKILKCSSRTVQRGLHRISRRKGAMRLVRLTDDDLKRLVGVR